MVMSQPKVMMQVMMLLVVVTSYDPIALDWAAQMRLVAAPIETKRE